VQNALHGGQSLTEGERIRISLPAKALRIVKDEEVTA